MGYLLDMDNIIRELRHILPNDRGIGGFVPRFACRPRYKLEPTRRVAIPGFWKPLPFPFKISGSPATFIDRTSNVPPGAEAAQTSATEVRTRRKDSLSILVNRMWGNLLQVFARKAFVWTAF
jgi:hypothetical protein